MIGVGEMRKVLSAILRCVYYIFPKFFREQYIESIIFYRRFFSGLVYHLNKKIIEGQESDFIDGKPRDMPLQVELVSNLDVLGAEFELLDSITGRYSNVSGPLLYVDNQECKRSPIKGELPDVKVVRLNRVKVIGSTDAVICGSKMFHHELNLMEDNHDLKRPEIFLKNDEDDDFDFVVSTDFDEIVLGGVIVSLLKEHSTNYYHWVTEVIPKLVNIMKHLSSNEEEITILIEDGVPNQSLDIIDLIFSEFEFFEYKLFRVKKGQLVYCESLIYCTPLWTSLDNTRSLPNPKKEFFVSSDCLKKVKDKLSKNTLSNNYILKNKKIYLQRENTKLRKLSNVLDLERLLYKKGFDFVDPGSLDFFEQYNLFSQAEVIVGASGAAFTNLLFMKPGSTAISLYPSAQSTNYYVFQPLADVSNVHLIHFLTTPDDNSNSVHGDANVDVKELEKLLEKLDD